MIVGVIHARRDRRERCPERRGIVRRYAEQQSRHQRAESETQCSSDGDPEHGEDADALQHDAADVRALRAEGETDAKFTRPLTDGIRRHAEDADAREHERQRRKRAHQTSREPRQRQRIVVTRLHRRASGWR
jgi:hypothetical protein